MPPEVARGAARARDGALGAALVLAVAVGALITYKASGALATLARAQRAGTLAPKAGWIPLASLPAWERPLAGTVNYFAWVVIALGFGVLLGALVRALVPDRWLTSTLAARGLRGQAVAAVSGAPLMLCSCCVSPLFEGIYERTRRLGPALALMFASPALNPAALALTFLLFPARIAGARLAIALVLVVFASGALGVVFTDARPPECPSDDGLASFAGAVRRFLASLREVAVRSLPAIALGALASACLVYAAPIASVARLPGGAWLCAVAVAAVAVPIAMPTFGEIPLALALRQAGAPDAAVIALLVAGPAINLPSLLTLRKIVSTRVALATAGSVFVLAMVGGALASL